MRRKIHSKINDSFDAIWIMLIILLFIIFISIMIPIGKSNISKWPILLKNDKEKGKSY
ncbi:MAG: hypothetical protein KAT05_15165 [Spirochaetes bacterium]|nr:hypothetical protein [Spirochaetota bacterium]